MAFVLMTVRATRLGRLDARARAAKSATPSSRLAPEFRLIVARRSPPGFPASSIWQGLFLGHDFTDRRNRTPPSSVRNRSAIIHQDSSATCSGLGCSWHREACTTRALNKRDEDIRTRRRSVLAARDGPERPVVTHRVDAVRLLVRTPKTPTRPWPTRRDHRLFAGRGRSSSAAVHRGPARSTAALDPV